MKIVVASRILKDVRMLLVWLLLGTLLGLVLWWTLGSLAGVLQYLQGVPLWSYIKRGGPLMLAILPLAGWTLWLVARRIVLGVQRHPGWRSDLEFIARNGTVFGMMGTILALASSGGFLEAGEPAGERVLSLVPVLGEALISTLAGLVLSLLAELILHIDERNRED